jgi:excisionase family DNA binding protein
VAFSSSYLLATFGNPFLSPEFNALREGDQIAMSTIRSIQENEPNQASSPADFLTIAEAAELLRVHRRTLDNMRWKGTGPIFRRHGGRIVYHRDELLAWSAERKAKNTRPR